MPSESDLAAVALRRIGRAVVTIDLGTSTKEARSWGSVYPVARSALLAEHTWDFAAQRAKLARMAQVPPFGFAYYYQMPPAFLRALTIQDGADCDICRYEIEAVSGPTQTALAMATDATEVRLRYVADNAAARDPNQMRTEFRNALILRCARDMCMELTGDLRRFQLLDAEYRAAVAQARSIDSMSGPPVRIPEPDEILIR